MKGSTNMNNRILKSNDNHKENRFSFCKIKEFFIGGPADGGVVEPESDFVRYQGTNKEPAHHIDLMKQKIKTLGQQEVQNQERILLETCPLDLKNPENKVRISGTIDAQGGKTFSIDGKPFVKIYPPEIINDFSPDGFNTVITATTKWERLEQTS